MPSFFVFSLQVCVSEGIGGGPGGGPGGSDGAAAARGFLQDRCAELQRHLGLGPTLLHPVRAQA